MSITALARLTAIGALLAACGDDDSRSATPTSSHDAAGADAANATHIEVDARSFAFDPSEITVAAGEDVAIVLTSTDSEHDFVIDELDVHVHADVGETSVGTFSPGEPGRYTIYCSIEGHREAGMEAELVVEA